MAFESTTPNMLLPVPGVGQTDGPTYATDVNNCFTRIDGHNHTTDNGVQIPPAGLNINSNLTFQSNSATNLYSSQYISQATSLTGASNYRSVYTVINNSTGGSDLWYTNGLGVAVQITNGSSIAAAGGSIGGLPNLAASVTFTDPRYVFLDTAGEPADLDFGSAFFRNGASPTFATELSSSVLTSNTHQTLPPTPANTAFITMDASGGMNTNTSTSGGITGSMIAVNTVSGGSGGNITLGSVTGAAAGSGDIAGNTITSANISPGTIANASLTNATITSAKIAANTITGSNIATTTVSPANLTVQSSSNSNISSSSVGSPTPVLVGTVGNPATGSNRNQMIMMVPQNVGSSAHIACSTVAGIASFAITYKQDTTTYSVQQCIVGAGTGNVQIPLGSFTQFAPSVGTGFSTWTVYLSAQGGSSAAIVNGQLVAYEM